MILLRQCSAKETTEAKMGNERNFSIPVVEAKNSSRVV
jgi:hypothetical protein